MAETNLPNHETRRYVVPMPVLDALLFVSGADQVVSGSKEAWDLAQTEGPNSDFFSASQGV